MSENAIVVVFPSVFSQNKIDLLISNIKKILKIQNQRFSKIRKDGSVIIVEANDPVFASSAINLLYGIEKVAIAKQVKNDFDVVVSSITKIGKNLLLKGETFYIDVQGTSSGFITKDVEISATSSLIGKSIEFDVKPGTKEKHNKLLHTYLTKSHAYICIFIDNGHGGIPYNSQNEKVLCCIYDELSAVSCLETIKEGFDVKLIICYKSDSELLNLVKIVNRLLPRMIQPKIELEFFEIKTKSTFLFVTQSVVELLLLVAKTNKIKKISFPLSSLIFPSKFINDVMSNVFKRGFVPWIPISSLNQEVFDNAREIGLEKYLSKIEKLGKMKFSGTLSQKDAIKNANQIVKTKKSVSVTVGPNNIHDVLDSLKIKH